MLFVCPVSIDKTNSPLLEVKFKVHSFASIHIPFTVNIIDRQRFLSAQKSFTSS